MLTGQISWCLFTITLLYLYCKQSRIGVTQTPNHAEWRVWSKATEMDLSPSGGKLYALQSHTTRDIWCIWIFLINHSAQRFDVRTDKCTVMKSDNQPKPQNAKTQIRAVNCVRQLSANISGSPLRIMMFILAYSQFEGFHSLSLLSKWLVSSN